ncbi:hypothetical protein [Dyadobacter diqingensis]|uniref:hypothetical protein n=1 Tax=Dyadobacter diqingensis TaxID=2938121 RepID=UPI0020C40D1D|nr:hypothetical protein [Dyadobacter diqingensis]
MVADRLRQYIEFKGLSVYSIENNLEVSRGSVSKIIAKGGSFGSSVLEKFLTIYTDLNAAWLLTGEGSMINKAKLESNAVEIPFPEEHEMEIIKREDGTEFRYLGDEHYLMVTPLVSDYAYGGYVSGWSDATYVDDLPRHAIVVEKLHFGVYRSFEVKGDSMDDDSREAISEGYIVTGRRIDQKHWKNKLHIHKYKDYVIHEYDGLIIKRIVAHDVDNGVITYESLNPNKELYPRTEISLSKVRELYNIVAVTKKFE